MDVQKGTLIISREDRAVDSVKLVTEGLRVGRLTECEVSLNHPSVSRLHAGINYIAGRFFIINLSRSSSTTLNGRLVAPDQAEALADGDVLQIGPFFLTFDYRGNELHIKVAQQVAMNIGEVEARDEAQPLEKEAARQRFAAKQASSEVASALKVFWGKRTREKAGRPSPLHPRRQPRVGKARFNWTPTRDLVRPWPFALFVWGTVVVAGLSVLAWYTYANAFAPQPISNPHTAATFTLNPPIATQANAGSCTICHSLNTSVEANCAACHQTEAFTATVIKPHREAGITCFNCHSEHRGQDHSPMNEALGACARCHNDNNKKLYNGKRVSTPHGGALFGYPVKNNEWVWKGLDDEELATKPELVELLKKNRVTKEQTRNWRNVQFHGIHLYRVRIFTGIEGIEDVDSENKVLSCSSCHRTGFIGANLDRTSPRQTCSKCHSDLFFERADPNLPGGGGPSCTSCHVQHLKDQHWRPAFFSTPTGLPEVNVQTPTPALIAPDK